MAEGAIQKAGNFLGVTKFGKGLASTGRILSGSVDRDIESQNRLSSMTQRVLYAAKREKDPIKRQRLLQAAQNVGGGISAEEIDPGLNLSNKEILGSAANIGLNILTPGAFKGGKAAIIGKNAALGAGFGLASGLEKNRSTSGVVGSTVGGALTGAALGTAGLAAKATKDFLTKTTPNWLMNRAIKPSLNELRKNVKYGTKTLGQELLDEGVKGNPQQLLELAGNKLSSLEDELQTILNSPSLSEARIGRSQLTPYIDQLRKAKLGTPGMGGDVSRIDSIIKSIPESMTLPEANQMKRRIYDELRDPAYRLDAKLGIKSATLKQVAKGLKTEIENAVGGTVIQDINRKLSIYGRLENAVTDQLARSLRNNGIGLTDAILIAGGEVGPKGFLAALLRHTAGSTRAMTSTANALNKGAAIGTGKIGQTVKGATRRAFLNSL